MGTLKHTRTSIMESTLEKHVAAAGNHSSRHSAAVSPNVKKTSPKVIRIGYWTVTALFCLQIGFTAYAQLRLPQVAQAFTHLGFPAYFRVELSWAKFLGIVLLLAPVPAWLKEWAYAGFIITLVRRWLLTFP
jgi:DoxX-like family